MIYREFDGCRLSLLGFGCMRFALDPATGEIDQEKVNAMFDLAIREGVNYFDTAYPYLGGKSETAMAVMPFILVLQLVFAGNIPLSENLDSVSYLTLSRWGYNAMLDLSDTALRSGWFFKEAAVRFPTCWIALILFTALYAFLARNVLKLIDRDGR